MTQMRPDSFSESPIKNVTACTLMHTSEPSIGSREHKFMCVKSIICGNLLYSNRKLYTKIQIL